MTYDGSIRIDTLLNTSGLKRGEKDIRGSMDRISNAAKKMFNVVASAFAIGTVAKFGKEAIQAASDLEAMESQFSQVFGNMESAAAESLSEIARQAGITEERMKASYTKIAAFAKTTGMDVAGSMELANRAMVAVADSAAFYDRSLEETTESLQSFLKGNYENDAALGLSATEFTRNAAANKLYGKSFIELSEAQKQLTLLQMVEDANRLSGALGQASREADTWTNQTGNLSQAWTNLKANLGKIVLPIAIQAVKSITNVINAINAMVSRLTTAASAFRSFSELVTGKKSSTGAGVPDNGMKDSAEGYNSAADAAENLADSTGKVAKATKDAKKAAAGYLSGLDEIHRYSGDMGESGAGGASGLPSSSPAPGNVDYGSLAEGETIAERLDGRLEKLMETLSGLMKPFMESWESEGKSTVIAMQTMLSSLGSLAESVGKSFYDVWTNGTGTKTLTLILQIAKNVLTTIGNIAEKLNEAWNTNSVGTSIIQGIFDIYNTILGTVERITRATAEWAGKLDFYPLLESINGLLESIQPLTKNIGDGLAWFYENVLLAIAGWTVQEAVPAFLDLLSAAVDTVNIAIDALKPAGQWLWDNFLQPLGEWAGDAAIGALRTLKGLLEGMGGWIEGHQAGFQAITVTVLSFFGAFKAAGAVISFIGVLSGLYASLGGIVNSFILAATGAGTLHGALVTLFGAVKTAVAGVGAIVLGAITAISNFLAMLSDGFSWVNEILMVLGVAIASIGAVILGAPAAVAAAVAGIVAVLATVVVVVKDNWDAICSFFSGAADWFDKNVIQPTVKFFKGLWEDVSGFFQDLWDDIKGIWEAVSGWFDKNVAEPVIGFFQGLYDRVKDIFEGLWIIIQAVWIVVSGWFDKNVIQPVVGFFKGLWESVSGFFSDLWDDVKEVWEAVSGWFSKNVTGPVIGFFKGVWTSVSGFFSSLWGDIKKVWEDVSGWFGRTVIEPVKNAWKSATDAIGGFFSSLWQGIARGVVGAMNAVIGGIESGINFIVGGINGILGSFNSIVSWAADIVGVGWGGVSLVPPVTLSRLPVPYLATGAVIPPNKEFLAVLGDQKHGRNIEAPEGLIRDIIRDEMRGLQPQANGTGNGNTYHFSANINRRVLFDEVIKEGRLRQTVTGGNPFELT